MTQYDAGPGDWSDRPWEDPDKKPQQHAKRRKVTLPPWALLAILIGAAIVLCVVLVLIVRAIRNGGDDEMVTPPPTVTAIVQPTATLPVALPTVEAPTPTVVLPIDSTTEPAPPTAIGPGATVVVKGTLGAGLNLRDQATTFAKITASAKEGTELVVLDGPKDADGFTWWQVRTPDGKEGWGAGKWMVLKGAE